MSTSSSVPGSPATASNYSYSSKVETRQEDNLTDSTNSNILEDLRHQIFQGQLYKFTNVVKGWQYRWFELHPETGHLEYYYYEDHGLHELVSGKDKHRKIGNKGKKEHIAGAVVVPSEEDSQTFNVNFASGESYKLRAPNVRERQIWVDRIRAVSQLHDRAIAHSNPPIVENVLLSQKSFSPPLRVKSHVKPREQTCRIQNLSLSALDAFGAVHDILYQANLNYQKISAAINLLPMNPIRSDEPDHETEPDHDNKTLYQELSGPFCHDKDLLLLKATSQSAITSVEEALALLQDLRELERNQQHQNHKYCPENKISYYSSTASLASKLNHSGSAHLLKGKKVEKRK